MVKPAFFASRVPSEIVISETNSTQLQYFPELFAVGFGLVGDTVAVFDGWEVNMGARVILGMGVWEGARVALGNNVMVGLDSPMLAAVSCMTLDTPSAYWVS